MVYREDANGKPVLNFNMVDEILDFLVSIRLRPLIQFSFMPKSLAKTPEDTFFTVPFIMSEPKDNTKWELLVTRFTEHVLYKYGLQEVSQWIFTFWNETLTGFPFDFKTEDTSFYLYELTAKAVRQVNPQLKFANTSFINSSTSTTKIKSFFEYVKEKNCEPDVYLFHFYPISESHFILSGMINKEKFMDYNYKNRTVLNNDPEAFGKYLDELNLLFPNRGDVPLYITEWNLSPSHRELLNDTCFAGVYFIRNILMNYDKVQGFGHWSLSDWIEELPFPAELFHGGVGHFTKSGIKKPAYYAYFFLSKLKDEIISMDDGYFITKERNKDNYSIILYHYCHFSDIYGKGFNFNFSPTDRYEIFNGAVNKELSFSLSGVADGEYRITEHIVNRRYGSCFDKWVEMGAAPLLNAEETDALKQLSHPLIKIKNHTVTKQLLDYEAVLEPHEIRLIQLSKKN
jgi:xylan 1,4-beta-xylosidase